MSSTLKTVTLLGAAVVFLFGGLTGFKLLTSSAETIETAPTCTNRTITAGQPIASNRIKVDVLNASARSGLANRVLINLQGNGFLGGTIGNSLSIHKPKKVAILTNDRSDPRVRLVAAQFADKVSYATPDIDVPTGVVVVVGDDYTKLAADPPSSITSDRDITVCEPTVKLP